MLHQRVVPCLEAVARDLQIPVGSRVIDLKRLRFVEDIPIQLVNTFIPYKLCPGLAAMDLANRSLYEYLETECGLLIVRGRRLIEAVAATELEARLLHVVSGAPLVMLNSISYLEGGRPVEYYHAVHRGDRSRFEIQLVRSHDPERALDVANLPRGSTHA